VPNDLDLANLRMKCVEVSQLISRYNTSGEAIISDAKILFDFVVSGKTNDDR
jgi:hypothetical protein